MRAALGAGSDLEMIEVLQVGREEMPEAIKTLQRALERVGEGEGKGGVSGLEIALGKGLEVVVVKEKEGKERGGGKEGKRVERSETILSKASSGSGGSGVKRDTLDREFIESGIDALRRLSLTTGEVETLPSWTITRFVHFFFSYSKTLRV
jgi:abelson tyrosine-protein kinase 1